MKLKALVAIICLAYAVFLSGCTWSGHSAQDIQASINKAESVSTSDLKRSLRCNDIPYLCPPTYKGYRQILGTLNYEYNVNGVWVPNHNHALRVYGYAVELCNRNERW